MLMMDSPYIRSMHLSLVITIQRLVNTPALATVQDDIKMASGSKNESDKPGANPRVVGRKTNVDEGLDSPNISSGGPRRLRQNASSNRHIHIVNGQPLQVFQILTKVVNSAK
jgi:hypothetical protein